MLKDWEFNAQVNILVTLRHPNIVMFMGLCLDPPCLVTEWCARGSLASVLHKALTQPDIAAKLSWYRRLVMALEIAKVRLWPLQATTAQGLGRRVCARTPTGYGHNARRCSDGFALFYSLLFGFHICALYLMATGCTWNSSTN